MKFDAYMLIDGVKGPVTDKDHKDWIQLLEVQHLMQQKAAEAGFTTETRGRSESAPYKIRKAVDKASPVLMERCHSGKPMDKVTIHMMRSDGGKSERYMEVILEQAVVEEVNAFGTQDDKTGVGEWVTFLYKKIKWTYSSKDGNTPGGWDHTQNKEYR